MWGHVPALAACLGVCFMGRVSVSVSVSALSLETGDSLKGEFAYLKSLFSAIFVSSCFLAIPPAQSLSNVEEFEAVKVV